MSALDVSPTDPEDLRNILHLAPTLSSCQGLKVPSFPLMRFQFSVVPQEKERLKATAESLLGVLHFFTSCMHTLL